MNMLKKIGSYVGGLFLSAAAVFAQEAATVPDATAISDSIEGLGGVAGAAAVVGLSIWAYRKIKAKAGQALG